jgi:MFS family permease
VSSLSQKLGISNLSGYDRQVWMLFMAEIINVLGTSMIRTFLAIYMFNEMHISMAGVGLALFVSSLAGAIASYAGGSISDGFGRKKILVCGLALQVIAYLLISVSIDASVPYLAFIAVLSFSALVQGLYQSVPDVMIADVVEPGRRVGAYGLLRIGANLGWVIGPVLGGFMLVFTPFTWVFYLAAVTTSIYLLIAFYELRETHASVKSEKLRLNDIRYIVKDTPFLAYTLIAGLMIIPYQQMYTLLSVYSSDVVKLSDFWIGVSFALSGVMVVLFQFAITMQVGRHRLTNALAFSTVVFAAGFMALTLSTNFIMPFVCTAVATLAEMVWAPAGMTMQANLAPEDRRGRYFGFAGLVTSLGFSVAPLAGGMLMDAVDDTLMWTIVSATFIVCGACYLLLNRVVPEAANAPGRQPPAKAKKLEAPLKA